MQSLAKGQQLPELQRGKVSHTSARHWPQQPLSFSGVHCHGPAKASTMDGDKRRLFLERMKNSSFFNLKQQQQQQSQKR